MFFYFQAEDGIRDYKVTGVQTCALPIFHDTVQNRRRNRRLATLKEALTERFGRPKPMAAAARGFLKRRDRLVHQPHLAEREIGRASCRERVNILEQELVLHEVQLNNLIE